MFNSLYTPRQLNWNRVLLNAFWIMLLVHVINQMYSSHSLLPDLIILGTVLLLECIYKWKTAFSEISITIGSYFISSLIVFFLSENIHVKPFFLLFPLLVSMIYLRTTYLILSSTAALLYTAAVFGTTMDSDDMRIEMIMTVSIIVATLLTGLAVIRRGQDLIRSLETSEKSEQDLRIQNIIMDRLSKIDPLTDLYNHKTFHEYFGWLIDHQQSNPFPMQLAILDIDNFKKVNDTYGHWVGDIALRQVAATILENIGADDFAARYGGEEFVVILTAKPLEASHAIMDRVRAGIAGLPIAEMEGKSVTVSIGMHDFQDSGSKSFVFQKADDALYEAKKTGKNKLVIH
ncbi:diguanylate cyclase (GGDEF)-like protein [Paenibacillus forsythiae]|uniref:Diguanylate cyclase (GGDEF)-like protein n=1 Tax=Paenibacillus forsythiae TaxID=365616 RepID=A0ABU3HBV0_9BACL|nr:GGDEF domain-containing protein [Paenibacillus forsythiae]MDT3428210.1 diguanylate cyclase (GGDEF)-like protein [Paenibacillus forsythiae]